jgi:hypothetical protein
VVTSHRLHRPEERHRLAGGEGGDDRSCRENRARQGQGEGKACKRKGENTRTILYFTTIHIVLHNRVRTAHDTHTTHTIHTRHTHDTHSTHMCQCTFEALPVGLLLRRTAPARDAACTADSTAPPPPPLTPPLACPPWVRDRCRGSGVYPPRHAPPPPPLPPAPSPTPPSPLAAMAAPGTKFEARNAPSTHVGGVSRYLRRGEVHTVFSHSRGLEAYYVPRQPKT